MQTIDLDRYPIHHPQEDGYRSLVARCRDDVANSGTAVLDGFVRSEALLRGS